MKHDVMEAWTTEEDRLLLHLIHVHGTSWKVIDGSFPSRTVSSIRNRYQRIVNGSKHVGKNRCQRCGMIKRGHICQGRVRTPDDDEVLLLSPVTERPSSPPWVNTEFRLDVDEDVTEDVTEGDESEDEDVSFPCHLFSWHTVQTANDMGFEGVTHPPPVFQGFPFLTSLP